MTYRTRYPHINDLDLHAAWGMAIQIDRELGSLDKAAPALTEQPVSRADLEQALVSLARRVAELEHKWS